MRVRFKRVLEHFMKNTESTVLKVALTETQINGHISF